MLGKWYCSLGQWTFQSLPYKKYYWHHVTCIFIYGLLQTASPNCTYIQQEIEMLFQIKTYAICNLRVSSIALNTAPAMHYRLGCISPHLEQSEMLLIHSFMLDSSSANTVFHWYCSVTTVYQYKEIWPTTWFLFLRKNINCLQFCHFQIKQYWALTLAQIFAT